MLAEARIGTSGFELKELLGGGLASAELVGQYAQLLTTVEINSFQRLPTPETLAAWAAVVPSGFQFALKLPRRISNELRLVKSAARNVSAFLEAASELGPHLGPVLVQLPPNFLIDLKSLSEFLRILPRGPRLAFEFRHASWHVPAVLRVLSAHEAALVITDEDEDSPPPRIDLTADFAYFRLRREREHRDSFWEDWAARLAALTRRGIDVYGYVKHDRRGVAIDRARRLAALLRNESSSAEQSLLT